MIKGQQPLFGGRKTLSLGIASLTPYQYGRYDDTTTPSQHKFMSVNSGYRFLFRGSQVNLIIGAGGNNPFRCRVDNGPWYRPLYPSGTRIIVASGLADTWHTLEFVADSGFTPGFVNLLNNATTCEVVGSQPQITADPNFNGSGTPLVIMSGASGTEALFVNATDSFSSNGGVAPVFASSKGTQSFRFKATIQAGYNIWVFNRINSLGWFVLETDGVPGPAIPTLGQSQFPAGPLTCGWTPVGVGDGTPHEYTIVSSRTVISDSVLLGGTQSSFDTSALASRLNFKFLGDSLTDGVSCAGDNNNMRSWSYLMCKQIQADTGTGIDCDNRAVSGRTTNNVLTNLTADLAGPKAPNVVGIWSGTNDGATDITADYTSILNGIFSAYPSAKVVCIGLANQQSSLNYVTQNTRINNAIAACSTPANCLYLDITGFTNYSACDGLHQTSPGGQTTCATNFKPTFRTAAGI